MRLHTERGFTIVEVMVAMLILLGGLVGVMFMLERAQVATASNKAREQGVALQRELVEAARGLPYAQLTQGSIVSMLRGTNGFGSSVIRGGEGWQIERRGITYTMAAGVCSVDDPSDGTGKHDGASFCATGAGKTSAQACMTALGSTGDIAGAAGASGATIGDCGIDRDRNGAVDNLTEDEVSGCTGSCGGSGPDNSPDDYKRIVTLVRWKVGEGTRFAVQSTTIPYPGFSGAPRITELVPQENEVVTRSNADPMVFRAKTDRAAQSVGWMVNGTPQRTPATNIGGGTSWEFKWELLGPPAAAGPAEPASGVTPPAPSAGEVLDGPYEVAARAYDAYGSAGAPFGVTVVINRRQPYAPKFFEAVRVGATVQTAWATNRERDLEGYEVYRKRAGGSIELVCTLSRSTACTDLSLPATDDYEYFGRAFDRNPSGGLRAGDASAWITEIPMANATPASPTNVAAVRSGGQVTITWQASPGDPEDGAVSYYRIFRDGKAIDDRIGITTTGSTLTFVDTDPGTELHTYYVSAGDSKNGESDAAGGVSA
jgi:type II secretory pathway pseudopilin PulG